LVRLSVTSGQFASICLVSDRYPHIPTPMGPVDLDREIAAAAAKSYDPDLELEALHERLDVGIREEAEEPARPQGPEEIFIRGFLRRGYSKEQIADLLGMSRFALRRKLIRLNQPPRKCKECGRELPRDATSRREYCPDKGACRQRAWRRRRAA
jgi:predicted Zn-ribbon and HTH transcriptional regulator